MRYTLLLCIVNVRGVSLSHFVLHSGNPGPFILALPLLIIDELAPTGDKLWYELRFISLAIIRLRAGTGAGARGERGCCVAGQEEWECEVEDKVWRSWSEAFGIKRHRHDDHSILISHEHSSDIRSHLSVACLRFYWSWRVKPAG